MLFRKMEKGKSKVEIAWDDMENGEFLLKDQMVYWKTGGRVTGTTAFEEDGVYRLDMDILDTWLWPRECQKTKLTQEEEEIYKQGVVRYLKGCGADVELEYSGQNGIASRRNWRGKKMF